MSPTALLLGDQELLAHPATTGIGQLGSRDRVVGRG